MPELHFYDFILSLKLIFSDLIFFEFFSRVTFVRAHGKGFPEVAAERSTELGAEGRRGLAEHFQLQKGARLRTEQELEKTTRCRGLATWGWRSGGALAVAALPLCVGVGGRGRAGGWVGWWLVVWCVCGVGRAGGGVCVGCVRSGAYFYAIPLHLGNSLR